MYSKSSLTLFAIVVIVASLSPATPTEVLPIDGGLATTSITSSATSHHVTAPSVSAQWDTLIWHVNNDAGVPQKFPWDLQSKAKGMFRNFAVAMWPTWSSTYASKNHLAGSSTGGIMSAQHLYQVSKTYADSIGATLQVWLLPENNSGAGTGVKLPTTATADELLRGIQAQITALEAELAALGNVKVSGVLVEKETYYDSELRTTADTVVAVLKSSWSSLSHLEIGYAEASFGPTFSFPSYASAKDYLPASKTAVPKTGSGAGVLPTFAWPDSYEPSYPHGTSWTGVMAPSNAECNSGTSACPLGCGCISPYSYGKQLGDAFTTRLGSPTSPVNIAVLGGPGANTRVQGSCGTAATYAVHQQIAGCSSDTDYAALYNAVQGLLASPSYQTFLTTPGTKQSLALYG
jgi:hypothetical protein